MSLSSRTIGVKLIAQQEVISCAAYVYIYSMRVVHYRAVCELVSRQRTRRRRNAVEYDYACWEIRICLFYMWLRNTVFIQSASLVRGIAETTDTQRLVQRVVITCEMCVLGVCVCACVCVLVRMPVYIHQIVNSNHLHYMCLFTLMRVLVAARAYVSTLHHHTHTHAHNNLPADRR